MKQVNRGALHLGKTLHITVQGCHASVHVVRCSFPQCYLFHWIKLNETHKAHIEHEFQTVL